MPSLRISYRGGPKNWKREKAERIDDIPEKETAEDLGEDFSKFVELMNYHQKHEIG